MPSQERTRQDNAEQSDAFERRFDRLVEALTMGPGRERDERLSGMGGNEEEAAREMVGQWLSGKVRSINEGLRNIDGGDRKARVEWSAKATELLGDLSELSAAMKADAFAGLAREGMGFTKAESDFLGAEIEALHSFSAKLALPLASEDAGESRIGSMRESPTWRQAVKNGTGRKLDHDSFFAPLLDCIAKESSPALRAEMTAKMELYIQSGHARNDCLTPREGASAASKRMNALCERLREDPSLVKDAMNIINGRFNELFMKVMVEQRIDPQGELDSAAVGSGARQTRAGRASEAGAVDAVIRDAWDPTKIHAAAVTADESTFIESDQLLRHRKALSTAIAEGTIPGAKSVELSFYAPCLFYDNASDKSRELGESFLSSMKDRLTPSERQTLNILPFLSSISRVDADHPNFPVDSLADFELRLIGAKADSWNESMRSTRAIKDPEARKEAFLSAAAAKVSDAIDVFSKKSPDEAKLRAGNSNRTLFASFCECLEGLNKHCVGKPELLAPIQANLRRLKALRGGLGKESEIRGRLASAIDPYDYPGGVEAWAAKRVESDQQERRLAQEARELSLSENAAHMAMVRAFIEELDEKGALGATDIRGLRAALKADTSLVLGFTESERKELDGLLDTDPKAARDCVKGKATSTLKETAASRSVPELHALVRHGAMVCGVGPDGIEPATSARLAGRPDAAAYLEIAKEKQSVEAILAFERHARAQERMRAIEKKYGGGANNAKEA